MQCETHRLCIIRLTDLRNTCNVTPVSDIYTNKFDNGDWRLSLE